MAYVDVVGNDVVLLVDEYLLVMLFDVEDSETNVAIIYQMTFEIFDLVLIGAGTLLFFIILISVLVRRGRAKRQARRERKAAKKAAKVQARKNATIPLSRRA